MIGSGGPAFIGGVVPMLGVGCTIDSVEAMHEHDVDTLIDHLDSFRKPVRWRGALAKEQASVCFMLHRRRMLWLSSIGSDRCRMSSRTLVSLSSLLHAAIIHGDDTLSFPVPTMFVRPDKVAEAGCKVPRSMLQLLPHSDIAKALRNYSI